MSIFLQCIVTLFCSLFSLVLMALELCVEINPEDVDALIMLVRFYIHMEINLDEVSLIIKIIMKICCAPVSIKKDAHGAF